MRNINPWKKSVEKATIYYQQLIANEPDLKYCPYYQVTVRGCYKQVHDCTYWTEQNFRALKTQCEMVLAWRPFDEESKKQVKNTVYAIKRTMTLKAVGEQE